MVRRGHHPARMDEHEKSNVCSECVPGGVASMLVMTSAAPHLTLPTQTMVSTGVMITNQRKMDSNTTLSQDQAQSSQHNNARTNGAVFLRIRKIKNLNSSLFSQLNAQSLSFQTRE